MNNTFNVDGSPVPDAQNMASDGMTPPDVAQPLAPFPSIPPMRTSKDKGLPAKIVTDHMRALGLPPLNKAGLFARTAIAIMMLAFRYLSDKRQWARFDMAEGRYVDVDKAVVTGALAEWILSDPLAKEREHVLATIPGRDDPDIRSAVNKGYAEAGEILADSSP